MPTPALLAVTLVLTVAGDVAQAAQSGPQALPPPRPPLHALTCRGGAGLVFDTLLPRADTGTVVRLSLTFLANPTAAGAEGQGLRPSTCAWMDRPVNDAEPRRVSVTLHYSDSTPGLTVRDTGMYWSFLAYNNGSGYLVGEGYRHWHASSPPLPMAGPAPSAARRWPPFDPRYLPWLVLGWGALVGMPMLVLTGWWSGWRRLARLYPRRNAGQGRTFRCGPMIMRVTNYRGGVRLSADDLHLHFSTWALLRPGHPPFSVPWSDISARRETWPWFPFKGVPVIRLTLARDRDLRILLKLADGERVIAASGGRLQLGEPPIPAAAAR